MSYFGLESTSLQVMVLVAFVVVLVVGVVVLPRWFRNLRSLIVAGIVQLLVMALSATLALFGVFLVLNKDNQWYTSWSDLLGIAQTDNAANVVTPPPPQDRKSGIGIDPHKIPGLAVPKTIGPKGVWLRLDLRGTASNITAYSMIWLPPSYLTKPKKVYPVLFAFPGYPGNPETFRNSFGFAEAIANLSKQGKMNEAIVVAPAVFYNNIDTECVDSTDKSMLMETYVTKDVRSWVLHYLRVKDDPKWWATYGYSAGGWCAAAYALRNPTIFSAAASLAGYFAPDFSKREWLAAGDDRYDMIKLTKEFAPPVHIWGFTGGGDQDAVNEIKRFAAAVRPPTKLTSVIQGTGGHRTDVWVAETPTMFAWLGANVDGFKAQ